jgi:PAS domain S-box-containing protein
MNTIKSKLLAIFLLIFSVIAANSIIAIINFSTLKNSIDNILKANYESVLYAQNMAIAIERQDSAELALMFETDKDKPKQVFKEYEKDFLKWLNKSEGNITEPGEDKIIANIDTYYEEYLLKFSTLETLLGTNSSDESTIRNYYYDEIFPIFEKIKSECRNLLNINQDKMVVLKNESRVIANRASYITLIISSVSLVFSIIFIIYLLNKIIKSINDLNLKIRNISEGNYRQQLNITGRDEIATLAKEFNIMASKLQAYEQLNINQLMKEKQKIEAIVESISDGIIVTGAANRVLLINKAAERIFEIREKDAMKRHFLEVLNNKELFEFIDSVRQGDTKTLLKDYMDISIKNKSIKNYYRAIVKAITNIEGESIGVVTLFQDITKLKEVDELKSEFVASVSHELRTPIASIMMAAELLQNEIPGKTSSKQKEIINIIMEDGNRLKDLIGDILDLSKLESGKMQLDIKAADPGKIVQYVLKIMEIQLKDNNVEFKVEIEDKLPQVLADFSKIAQVLTNLISNSMNYRLENKILSIKIGAKLFKDKVLFQVSDNGRGIPEEDLKKIFDKFVRTGENYKNTPEGTGLGLAISKSIIKSHGGEIWAESKPGSGSTFFFTLDYKSVDLKKEQLV